MARKTALSKRDTEVEVLHARLADALQSGGTLREAHAQLEVRIQARTDELSQTVSELQAEIAHRRQVEATLAIRLEELQIAEEELRSQNESLAAAQAELQDQSQGYQALFDFAPDGYLVTDRKGTISEANQAAALLLDVPSDRLVGTSLVDYVAEAGDPQFQHVFSQLLYWGEVRSSEVLLKRGAVKAFPAEITAVTILGKNQAVSGMRWALRDITERKQAEQEREHLLQQLEAEKTRWQATVDNMLDPVTVCDAEGRAIYMNAAYSRLVERQIDASLAVADHSDYYQLYRPDGTLFPIEDLPLQRAALADECVQNVEIVQRTPRGADRVVIWNASPLHDASGRVSGAVAVGRDITAQRRAERALQAKQEELILFNQDLTAINEELRVQQEALRQSEARFRTLFETMTEGFALHDIICDIHGVPCDYRFVTVNPAFERLTGLTRANVVGKLKSQVAELRDDDPRWTEAYGKVALCGEPAHFENYSPPLKRWYDVYAYCPEPGQFAVIFTDMTERKTAEDALRQARDELEVRVQDRTAELLAANTVLEEQVEERRHAEEAVRQNAQRLAAVAETSHVLVKAGFNDQTMLDQAARALALFLGQACIIHLLSDDGQRLDLAASYHAEPGRQDILRAVLAAAPTGVTGELERTVFQAREPVFMPTPSAEDLRHFGPLTGLPLPDQFQIASLMVAPLMIQTSVLGTVTLFRSPAECPYTAEDLRLLQSIADRVALAVTNARLHHDLEESLTQEKAMRQQLVQAEKLSALGRMVGSVAHELNNPLQTITNCLYLTDQELAQDSPIHTYLEMVQAETQRLVDLVAQLREVYRIRPAGAPEARRLDRLLLNVQALMSPLLQSANVQWRQPAEPPGYMVNVIQDRLKQVFINLVTNAIEAMRPAGGWLEVGVALSADGRQVGVSFKDTGPGISPEHLNRLFEPFFTTKVQGLGLGLAICYEIVQQHGGQIAVESQPGQGAVFTVWLPLLALA